MAIPFVKELEEEIILLNQALLDNLYSQNKLLNQTSSHLIKAGGKRIRPIFASLASNFGNCSKQELLSLMVAIEMIHLASLIHDDVIDNAQIRRGVPTLNAKWDNKIAIETGDYILGKSLAIISSFANKRVPSIFINICSEIVKGEVLQFSRLFDPNQSFKDYFYTIRRKTALLISASCQLGAIISNAPPCTEQALKKYGYNLGMAFQIIDDILDFTLQNELELGKPIASDLKQGILTLPTLFALKTKTTGNILRDLIRNGFANHENVKHSISIIKTSDALQKSQLVAKKYINTAKNNLNKLPESTTKTILLAIADLVENRKY